MVSLSRSISNLLLFPQFVMELTFTEAAKGASKELSVNIDDVCPRCDGKANEPGTKVSHCHYCNGTGMVSVTPTHGATQAPSVVSLRRYSATEHHAVCRPLQESVNTGPFMMRTPCRRCGGRGSIIITHCALCRGTGQTKKRQTVTVPVPAGRFQPGMSDKSTASKLTTHTEDCM